LAPPACGRNNCNIAKQVRFFAQQSHNSLPSTVHFAGGHFYSRSEMLQDVVSSSGKASHDDRRQVRFIRVFCINQQTCAQHLVPIFQSSTPYQ
jgi:hypothetical protein